MNRSKLPATHPPSKPQPQDAAQIERFKEAARALGCDDDEAAFNEKLRTIAKARPKGAALPSSDPKGSGK